MGEQRLKRLAISPEPESPSSPPNLPPNGGGDKGDKAQTPQHLSTGFWFSPFPPLSSTGEGRDGGAAAEASGYFFRT
ncbi:hypothetical protein ITX54_05030 [Rouxiella silvae]|uniref:Uncharacterized protein n=1 Tax=Rouxiella silvae TaxID=1646373 RepID=A0AA41BVL1_9GAMM|nr:hypothetical protein [Rouxiella silvae]MBF6636027.1 hypothetical protein [Rouxiella silvae]